MSEERTNRESGYQRVLITGAAGTIGSVLREGLRGCYPALRLLDRNVAALGQAGPGEEIVEADIRDMAQMEQAMAGVEAVVHLAASANGREWSVIHDLNVQGLYTTVEAAKRQGVMRVVFASSNHAMGMYPVEGPLTPELPARPDSFYGLSKAFAEDLLRQYVDKYGLEAVCIRIGSFQPEPQDQRQLQTWLSHRDGTDLVHRALEQRGLSYLIVLGFSANARLNTVDPNAARLRYRPQDNAEAHVETLRRKGMDVDGPLEWRLLGGPYTVPDFDIAD